MMSALPAARLWCLGLAAVLLSVSSVSATEETGESDLTVRRTTTGGFPPATPLTSGTISVVRATTATDELLAEVEPERGEEEETEIVPYATLPEAVRATTERQLGGKGDYRAAKYTDQGATMYQVSAIKDGLALELVLTEEGELAFETREIPFSKLPAGVQASLRQRHPDGKFTSIQAVTAHAYSAIYRNEQGEEVEVRIEPSGIIQSDPEEETASQAVPDNIE